MKERKSPGKKEKVSSTRVTKSSPLGNTGQQITGWDHRQEKQLDKDSVTSYSTLGKPASIALITGQSWLSSPSFSQ